MTWPRIGSGRVEIEGQIEVLASLVDPLSGKSAVAVEYHASPPSLLSVQGPGDASRAFTMSATQATDFVLVSGSSRVLIRVAERQDDVAAVHRHLAREYGLQLRAETLCIRAGDFVRVQGVAERGELGAGSPYRTSSYTAIVRAQRFWAV